MRREYNQQIGAAWTTAALSRAKRMPKLDDMLIKDKAVKRRQTWRDHLAIAQAWHAAVKKRAG